MSDVMAIVSQALGQAQSQVFLQVGVSVLKRELDLQKETAKMLLETLGVGQNLDLKA